MAGGGRRGPRAVDAGPAAARTFTAWAHRSGRLPGDPGLRLQAPERAQHLPRVLGASQVAGVLDAAAAAARDAAPQRDPLVLRDSALLELLYATGCRVAEVVGLDTDDVDLGERTARVLGKGDRERVVPFGVPARDAVRRWLEEGRPGLVGPESGSAVFLGRRAGGWTSVRCGPW